MLIMWVDSQWYPLTLPTRKQVNRQYDILWNTWLHWLYYTWQTIYIWALIYDHSAFTYMHSAYPAMRSYHQRMLSRQSRKSKWKHQLNKWDQSSNSQQVAASTSMVRHTSYPQQKDTYGRTMKDYADVFQGIGKLPIWEYAAEGRLQASTTSTTTSSSQLEASLQSRGW